ncbi:MAG: enoyl-CoA hydratase-related protein [Acidobacteriota bacterium]
MAYEFIEVVTENHITVITINRAEVMNSLHPAANHELDRAFNNFAEDDDQWVGIVTGAGEKAFSAGNDLKFQAENGSKVLREQMKGLTGGFGGITRRTDLFKPLIAAVNGFALGGGFEIVMACDIVIASEAASFGLPEPRVGLLAAAGGVHRLPRQLSFHQAMGMLLTGRRVSAAEALDMGLVNQVVAPDALLSTAREWAAQILECSPLSIRATKEAALRGLGMPLEQAVDMTFPGQLVMQASEDFVEGPKAFAEKRKPDWKGR